MKSIIFILLVVLISSCTTDPLGEEFLVISDNLDIQETPSCSFDDDAEISNYPFNPTYWYSSDYQDIYTFQRCTFQPVGYSENFVTQFYGSDKFEDIEGQHVYNLAVSEDIMQLFFRKDSEFSYAAYEGKLYMERINYSVMKFTWCDVKFLDDKNKTLVSSGSFSVRF